MLHKRHNSVITLAILLTFVGVSKPAKALLLAQAETAPPTFSLPDQLPQNAKVQIAASNSTSSINESLKESFSSKYPKAQVNIKAQDSSSALRSLSEGKADLVSIGRPLTPEEKAQGFVEVPISREKIAIVVSPNNSYDGSLTIEQFAQIFRGEITDWSELGGTPGKIQLVDLPDSNDTRQAFPSYSVFQSVEFSTGSNTVKLEEDSTDAMVAQLGDSGVGYAVANDVIGRDDVKIVTMHQTQPSDPKYPFSQPFSLVYKDTPSKATQAYLGFATTEGGQEIVAKRVGSLAATTGATAIAPGLAESSTDNNTDTSTAPQADAESTEENAVAGADTDVETPEENAVADTETDAQTPEENAVANTDADAQTPEENAVAGADADVDVETPEENAVADAETDAQTPEEGAVADADAETPTPEESAVADADTDTEAPEEETVTNAETDAEGSVADIDADVDVETPEEETVANADINGGVNVEGGGEINPDLEGSGEINPEVEGSGEINPDLEGSGEINPDLPDLEDSGSPNPDFEGSGEVNPDLEDSGKPLSSDNSEIDNTNTPETAIADGEVIKPNTAEGETSGVETTAKKGGWWWWLLPILGIPLLGAIFAFGGRKKSDQEPAISNIPNPDVPNRGIGVSGGADGGDVSAVGANVSGNLDSVTGNTVDTSSKLGNAAIATGGAALAGGAAAAANFVGDKKRAESDTDIDLDEPESVTEIPSNPVSEFTGQETKLQTDVKDDLNEITAGFTDDMSASTSALGAGAAATSGFSNNVETSREEGTAGIELDTDVSELETNQTTDLIDRSIDDVSNSTDGIEFQQVSEANIDTEFSGDFVLEEETQSTLSSEQDTVIDAPEVSSNINLDLSQTTEGISGTVTDEVEGIKTPEVDLPDVNLDGDSDLNIVDRTTEAGGAAIAGGAAALGGAAAAASGFFNRNQDTEQTVDAELTSEQDTVIDAPEVSSELNLDLSQTTEGISGTVTDEVEGIKTPEVDLPDVNLDGDSDLNIVDRTTEAGGAAIAGGAAALGGAAAAASGFFNRNQDTEQTVDAELTSETTSTDVGNSLEEMTLDDAANMPELSLDEIVSNDSDTSINASLEEITLDDATNSSEVRLEEITFEDLETNSTSNLSEELDMDASSQDTSLDDLGFEESESADSLSADPLSNNTAEITELSDDQSNDMNNISEWLDSLETPKQSTDNISEWLNTINANDQVDSVQKKENQDTTTNFAEEADDISFKFLEDLLDRNPNPDPDNQ